MWGLIKTNVSKGWFVPSRGEWSAFAQELGINKTNYPSKGLSDYYWSSSQYNTDTANSPYFSNGIMSGNTVNGNSYVRLSRTF